MVVPGAVLRSRSIRRRGLGNFDLTTGLVRARLAGVGCLGGGKRGEHLDLVFGVISCLYECVECLLVAFGVCLTGFVGAWLVDTSRSDRTLGVFML